jgi:hypothetical protein
VIACQTHTVSAILYPSRLRVFSAPLGEIFRVVPAYLHDGKGEYQFGGYPHPAVEI